MCANRTVLIFVAAATALIASPVMAQVVAAQTPPKVESSMPAQPDAKVTLVQANATSVATVRDLAGRARAAKGMEGQQGTAMNGADQMQVPPIQPIPLAQRGAATPAKAAFDPRLISIIGRRDRERVELTMDGVIYTVSLQNPNVGNTGWRLVRVDAEDASVLIARTSDGPATSKTKKGFSAYTIGFSRKDPADDTQQNQSGNPPFGMMPPAGMPGVTR